MLPMIIALSTAIKIEIFSQGMYVLMSSLRSAVFPLVQEEILYTAISN